MHAAAAAAAVRSSPLFNNQIEAFPRDSQPPHPFLDVKKKKKKPNIFYHLKQTPESIHPSVTLRARPCKYPRCGCHNKPSSISRDFEKKASVLRLVACCLGEKKRKKKEKVPAKLNLITFPIAREADTFYSEQKPKSLKAVFFYKKQKQTTKKTKLKDPQIVLIFFFLSGCLCMVMKQLCAPDSQVSQRVAAAALKATCGASQ